LQLTIHTPQQLEAILDKDWHYQRLKQTKAQRERLVYSLHFPVYILVLPKLGVIAMEVEGIVKRKDSGVMLWDSLANVPRHRCVTCRAERDGR